MARILSSLPALALRVFATTPDLASLARAVGGDAVAVEALAHPRQNPHFVEPKPSLIVRLMKADLLIETGLELELPWLGPLVTGARNRSIQPGASGRLDASEAVEPLEVPAAPTRALGDVHPGGNPHYLTDPENARRVARLIEKKLAELDPPNAKAYAANADAFDKALAAKLAEWSAALKPYAGAKYVGYHKDAAYFAKRFGLVSAGEIEPKPGIPPTPRHTAALIERMKAERVRLIFTHPWFESRSPASIAQATGAEVVTLALFPEEVPGTPDLLAAIGGNVERVARVLGKP